MTIFMITLVRICLASMTTLSVPSDDVLHINVIVVSLVKLPERRFAFSTSGVNKDWPRRGDNLTVGVSRIGR